jgi:hypothetical protein
MDLPPQNDAFGASIGGMKKADAFFMLVFLIGLNVGCSRAAKKKLPETR